MKGVDTLEALMIVLTTTESQPPCHPMIT